MGLLVGQHLDAVLGGPQLPVGPVSSSAAWLETPAASSARRASRVRGERSWVRPPRSIGLGEELDLADAAAPQLEFPPPRSAPALVGVIWRLMEWISEMAAKSRDLRQMKAQFG